jgi:alkylhydroperoxidase family enzyme
MAFIRTVPPKDATGTLKRQYDAATKRAGGIANVVSVQSLNPPVMAASLRLYESLMLGRSSLTRAVREMIAVVVSRKNDCFY